MKGVKYLMNYVKKYYCQYEDINSYMVNNYFKLYIRIIFLY